AEIKADPVTKDIEVVMVTGMSDQDLKRKSLELDASDLLNKPIVCEDLVARLKSVLRMKSYRDELLAQNTRLEKQLIQSQKMEVIGTLAAGITHDLNNMLASIIGYSEISERMLGDDKKLAGHVSKIKNAGERARKLVRQILYLSKKHKTSNEICSLNSIIDECLELLSPSIPSYITIEWSKPKADHLIEAETTQIYQVVMNLCINAIHSMKDEGLLRISLAENNTDTNSLSVPEIQPGQYIRLKVMDTGKGMGQDTLEHIFSPLFTTKSEEGGTGLGLSVVQYIVNKYGGHISVESVLGKGTTFYAYFPSAKSDKVKVTKTKVLC
ncbi:MAG: ATP-binding protein, partial [candidate division Zixibacteria bacterium]